MKKTFIFDLDDTLIYNLHDYSQPIIDFTKLVIERIGPRAPDIPTIINLEDKIDREKVKEWIPLGKGFSKERFPTSLKETYQEIAKPLGIEDKIGEELAYKIGTQAFSMERWKKQGLVPGAVETIDYLKSKGDELILMTKGDDKVQKMKIKANNLEEIFKKTYIVPTKNKEIIYSVLNTQNLDNVWHIGNSIKSDILPAIDAKIGAI
jgi:putative hydrolase of the HAD superfamily